MTTAHEPTVTLITARGRWALPDLAEIWRARAMITVLAQREVKVRYVSAVLGAAWALVSPLAIALGFAIGFGAVAGIKAPGGAPYWLWAWSGVIAWQCFAIPLGRGAASLVDNERLLGRVYLPRLVLPVAAVLAGLIDVSVSLGALLLALCFSGHPPEWQVVLLPLALLPALLLGSALGIGLSALNARYRDLRHALPVLTQLLLLVCPVGYPNNVGSLRAQTFLAWNPLTPALELTRWCLLPGLPMPDLTRVAAAAAFACILLLAGMIVFRQHERSIVDLL